MPVLKISENYVNIKLKSFLNFGIAFKILEGVRGRKIADIEAIIDIIMKLSHLSLTLKDSVAELDINPLIVFEKGKGAKVLDALVIGK